MSGKSRQYHLLKEKLKIRFRQNQIQCQGSGTRQINLSKGHMPCVYWYDSDEWLNCSVENWEWSYCYSLFWGYVGLVFSLYSYFGEHILNMPLTLVEWDDQRGGLMDGLVYGRYWEMVVRLRRHGMGWGVGNKNTMTICIVLHTDNVDWTTEHYIPHNIHSTLNT